MRPRWRITSVVVGIVLVAGMLLVGIVLAAGGMKAAPLISSEDASQHSDAPRGLGSSSERAKPRGGAADLFTFGSPDFCAPKDLVRDFGLSRLPEVREPPEAGDLPFGPKTVSLILPGGPLLPIGESFGYRLSSTNYYGHTPLDWTLKARIVAVGRGGRERQEVDRMQRRIRTITSSDEVKMYLDPLRRPGFYRYDFEIIDSDGQVLGRYGEHLKVFGRSFWKVRLGLSGSRFHPGQRVLSRVENLGTESVEYGEAFSVQRFEGDRWVHDAGATPGAWLLWGGWSGPGASGRCSSLYVDRDFPAGRYRIVKEVERPSRPKGKRLYRLVAPFWVSAA